MLLDYYSMIIANYFIFEDELRNLTSLYPFYNKLKVGEFSRFKVINFIICIRTLSKSNN
jgi:hypothetical protein